MTFSPESLPDWQNPVIRGMKHVGGRVRVALWLIQVVGEGNPFTKAELRAAFPGDAQIDRRLRDLRDWGWVVHTSRDDPSLRQEEQRFVSAGVAVWIPHQTRPEEVGAKGTVNSAERARIMREDDYMCRICGITAGEGYEDGLSTAKLVLSRRDVSRLDGTTETTRVTLCERCARGASPKVDIPGYMSAVSQLSDLERRALRRCMKEGRRQRSEVEELWGVFGTLPASARQEIQNSLDESED
ncbi:hypothetical protein [Streptomyces sp. NPDC007088]|uniref:hypothetical protein n=1 Tax=Streptomyces sp. NPDC007088 TaxID=3364773 RepID=UPI0036C21209